METKKSIMEQLDDILLATKDLEVMCRELREDTFNFMPHLDLLQKIIEEK